MSRQMVSYDDITIPYDSNGHSESATPPSKKLKKNNGKAKNSGPRNEGRELTQDEIWDDSALVDAWNAANEEYEAYHGPGKPWKTEPGTKSSLWYNTPRSKTAPVASAAEPEYESNGVVDSQPVDFDTFVPSHDPSLDLPSFPDPPGVPGPDYSAYFLPRPPGTIVSKDEAFNRALGAMYWGGYWTAMYHAAAAEASGNNGAEDGEDDEEESSDSESQSGFVSTQRE